MLHFLEGIFIGFLVVLAPGPATIYVIEKTIESGFSKGALASLGIVSSDLIYAFLALIGVAELLTDIPGLTLAFWFFAGALLIYMGVRSFLDVRKGLLTQSVNKHSHPYLGGFFLNLFAPPTVVFWVMISFAFLPQNHFSLDQLLATKAFLVDSGILVGTLLFFLLIALFVSYEKNRAVFSEKFWIRGAEILGIILVGIGCYFLYKGFLLF